MGSRDMEEAPPLQHQQPLLSSLIVRASNSNAVPSPDRDLRRVPVSPYSRSSRYPQDPPGYRIRAGSASPVRRSDTDHHYGSDYTHLSRNHRYGSGRDAGRYRDPSPPFGRGRAGGRPIGRAFDKPSLNPGPVKGDGVVRNNPNVRPREGDWICPDPRCGNLNFARRDNCNNCNRPRNARAGSPRRAYLGPPPSLHAPPRHLPVLAAGRSPERTMNGYRSPPRRISRDGPREYLPPLRHERRFPDPHMPREGMDYIEDAYRGRNRFDRSPPLDLGARRPARDDFSGERNVFERRPPSPRAPLLPHRGYVRERSRSPIRGGPPPKDYRHDMYADRIRDDRRGVGRDKIRGMY